jgi:GntR family transcriptional regulator
MFESINIHSSVAVYEQIENHIEFAIASGRLKSGDQLPSVRELSERVHVNMNTVAKCYRDLEVMGLLYARRGMGVFVQRNVEAKCREQCRKRIIGRLHEVCAEAKSAGMNKKELAEVADASFALETGPYSEMPASLLTLGKAKKPTK